LNLGQLNVGQIQQNVQHQINIVDGLSTQLGPHSLKVGIDFRRLSPLNRPARFAEGVIFDDVGSAGNGNVDLSFVTANLSPTFLFRNLGVYFQDTWRVSTRLTLTYGLRWDVDFVPRTLSGPNFDAAVGFDLNDLSNLALAPAGTPPYKTEYSNLAPRVGAAYQVSQNPSWQTVLRGGFGTFYDLASSEAGNQIPGGNYPFGSSTLNFGGTFPLSPAMLTPPPITPPNASNGQTLYAFHPNLQTPYTLEWDVAAQQGLGQQQSISASYVGASGRRLLQTAYVSAPNANLSAAQLVTNAGYSDYSALQVQFQRRLSRGLQVLSSYTWSHSIDTGSAGSVMVLSNLLVPGRSNSNRGPSDFDIRNSFTAAVTYSVPSLRVTGFSRAILKDWSLENIVQVRSAPPVDLLDGIFNQLPGGIRAPIRPDLIVGQPLYVYGSSCAAALGAPCPGGRGFNPNAFTDPPFDPNTFIPLRQGNVPRNFLRGFGAAQWDFAIHREFRIRESLKLQFRGELFNILNHPNFGPPNSALGYGGFGLAFQTLNGNLAGVGGSGAGGFNSLYQIGGPRSIQLAAKISF